MARRDMARQIAALLAAIILIETDHKTAAAVLIGISDYYTVHWTTEEKTALPSCTADDANAFAAYHDLLWSGGGLGDLPVELATTAEEIDSIFRIASSESVGGLIFGLISSPPRNLKDFSITALEVTFHFGGADTGGAITGLLRRLDAASTVVENMKLVIEARGSKADATELDKELRRSEQMARGKPEAYIRALRTALDRLRHGASCAVVAAPRIPSVLQLRTRRLRLCQR